MSQVETDHAEPTSFAASTIISVLTETGCVMVTMTVKTDLMSRTVVSSTSRQYS